MYQRIRNKISQIIEVSIARALKKRGRQIEEIKLLEGKNLTWNQPKEVNNIQEAEFKVFSQWGDDGIIQHIIKRLHNRLDDRFIEFGVENYFESNTRFLLQNNNWRGLIFDSSNAFIDEIRESYYFWQHDLTAACAFITKENINKLIDEHNFNGEIGLLHIDIDGNDYWIWEAINNCEPVIAIIEYNSLFGKERPVTIPYQPDFSRNQAHYSNLFAGCSISALCSLAKQKGYDFIGTNSAGNNAYFIKSNENDQFRALTPEEGYTRARFRESRDKSGKLSYLGFEQAQKLIRGCEVYNVLSNKLEKF